MNTVVNYFESSCIANYYGQLLEWNSNQLRDCHIIIVGIWIQSQDNEAPRKQISNEFFFLVFLALDNVIWMKTLTYTTSAVPTVMNLHDTQPVLHHAESNNNYKLKISYATHTQNLDWDVHSRPTHNRDIGRPEISKRRHRRHTWTKPTKSRIKRRKTKPKTAIHNADSRVQRCRYSH